MRDATRPAVLRAKSSIRGADLSGTRARTLANLEAPRRAYGVRSPRLRNSIANAIKAVVRSSVPMVRIEVGKTPEVRGFENAGKRTQEPKFRHPVFGNREVWVNQRGKKDWFRQAVLADTDRYKRATHDAMAEVARQLAASLN
jgi:hypothetical protein